MEAQYELLRQFTKCLQANPDILHEPKLGFFRDYLESLGATIPAKKETAPPPQQPKKEEAPASPEETPMEEDEHIPMPDLDNSGVIEADSDEKLPMGEEGKEATEEELDQANDARDRAMAAFSEGNFEEAVKEFTTAITLNPGSAIMHAKRANALLKLKKPVAAINDCDMAIKINPDSAQGYKFRGRANRLLGKWVEAHTDLAMACKLDYDDTANEWLKEVEPNAKKLQEYNRAVARTKEQKELQERRERVRKAQEANRKAAEEAAKHHAEDDEDMGGMPGGMPGMFNDPELASLLEDPEVAAALQEAMTNRAGLAKHMSNPKVVKALGKLQGMFGGGMPGFPGGGGFPGGFPSGGCSDSGCADSACGEAPKPPPKAPEPDLD